MWRKRRRRQPITHGIDVDYLNTSPDIDKCKGEAKERALMEQNKEKSRDWDEKVCS